MDLKSIANSSNAFCNSSNVYELDSQEIEVTLKSSRVMRHRLATSSSYESSSDTSLSLYVANIAFLFGFFDSFFKKGHSNLM